MPTRAAGWTISGPHPTLRIRCPFQPNPAARAGLGTAVRSRPGSSSIGGLSRFCSARNTAGVRQGHARIGQHDPHGRQRVAPAASIHSPTPVMRQGLPRQAHRHIGAQTQHRPRTGQRQAVAAPPSRAAWPPHPPTRPPMPEATGSRLSSVIAAPRPAGRIAAPRAAPGCHRPRARHDRACGPSSPTASGHRAALQRHPVAHARKDHQTVQQVIAVSPPPGHMQRRG
jgi:hypothetical protein